MQAPAMRYGNSSYRVEVRIPSFTRAIAGDRVVLEPPDAIHDNSMRWNNGADGAACFPRIACPQVV